MSSFYGVHYKYQIGEVIAIENDNGINVTERKAKVLSYGKTQEYGEEESTVKVQYLDNNEEAEFDLRTLTYRANLPIVSMMQIVEGVMQIWMRATRILSDENEREHVIKTIAAIDRMIGESAADNLALLGLPSEGLCVVLEEEYGYRHHLWFPEMELAEFIAWWENLASVSGFFFNPATTLPGKVATMETTEEMAIWRALDSCGKLTTAHIHTDGDSFVNTPDGKGHYHKGYDEHYFDPKPCDTVMETDGEGNIVDGPRQREENPCCGCPHHAACQRENKDEEQVDVPNLPDDSGEGKGS